MEKKKIETRKMITLVHDLLSYQGVTKTRISSSRLLVEGFTGRVRTTLKKLCQRFGVEFDALNNAIIQHKALIAGGSLTSMVTRPMRDVMRSLVHKWSDMDVYVTTNANAHVNLIEAFQALGFEMLLPTMTPPYDESFMRKNSIAMRVPFMKKIPGEQGLGVRIDVLVVHDIPLLQVVTNFDLTCCEIWYDGYEVRVKDETSFQRTRDNVRECFMNPEYVPAYIRGNKFLRARVAKYEARGFYIMIPRMDQPLPISFLRKKTASKFLSMDIDTFLLKQLVMCARRRITNNYLPFIQRLSQSDSFLSFPFKSEESLMEFQRLFNIKNFLKTIVKLKYKYPSFARRLKQRQDLRWLLRVQTSFEQRDPSQRTTTLLREMASRPADAKRLVREHLMTNYYRSTSSMQMLSSMSSRQFAVTIFSEIREPNDIYVLDDVWNTYSLETLRAFDPVMHDRVNIREYLNEDPDNVIIVYVVNGKAHASAMCLQGPGGLTDVANAKYFIRCQTDEEALVSSTETTFYKEWYYKVFGENFNVLIPLVEMSKATTNMSPDINSRLIFALEPSSNMFANSSNVDQTIFLQDYNVFGELVNLVSGTHCNAKEYFMDLKCPWLPTTRGTL